MLARRQIIIAEIENPNLFRKGRPATEIDSSITLACARMPKLLQVQNALDKYTNHCSKPDAKIDAEIVITNMYDTEK